MNPGHEANTACATAGRAPAAPDIRVSRFRGPAGSMLHVALARGARDEPLPANGGLRLATGRFAGGGPCRLSRRLAAEMLLKHQLHRTGFSGAKLVLTGARAVDDELLAWTAAVLDQYAGTLYTGADMGVTAHDMARLACLTPYVLNAVGSPVEPHVSTAFGVLGALEAWSGGPVAGLRVLVHGAGKVGAVPAAELAAAGATVLVHDSAPGAAEIPGCLPVRDWAAAEVDVFMPCSASDLIGPALARRLSCGAVIGSANAVLADEAATLRVLADRGIVHLPTPLVNAGAVIVDSIEYYAPAAFRTADPEHVYAFVTSTVRESVARLLAEADTAEAPATPTALLRPPPEPGYCGPRFARSFPAELPHRPPGEPASDAARTPPSP
ncbi:hypothetical protein [Streptomyces xanthochromogenes]|uniref:hypothetical protein n=1 Tax=Streptomyces xanthochromogenes TaxID=67384 RepID=UPI003427BBB6